MVVHSILLFAILVATQIDDRKSSQDLPEITSVSLSTHSPFTIKPCQSVDLALEIKMASPIDITTRRQALHRISQSVRVNGYEYRNRLSNNSGMNDAAIFELGDLPTANEMPNRESSSFLVTLRMFVDAEAKDCLFSVSGEYDVELNVLGDSFRFTITVEPPTRTEEQIVSLPSRPNRPTIRNASDLRYPRPSHTRGIGIPAYAFTGHWRGDCEREIQSADRYGHARR